MFLFAESLINKGGTSKFQKETFLESFGNNLETFFGNFYLSVFQRLGKKFPFAENLINKRKHFFTCKGLKGPADT